MNPSELNRLLEMAARFDPTRLAAQVEQASKMFDPARVAAHVEQASKMFDPARVAALVKHASKMAARFDPAQLAALVKQASKIAAQVDPARLAAQVEQAHKAASRLLVEMPRLTPELFVGAWDEQLAAAVGRLETRAEGILAAQPEPELKTVEALSADMGAVIEAAPTEAREKTKTGLKWLLVFLVDAIAGDPAKEAVRQALMELLVVLSVMVTDPTLPTPPPAPALPQPEALAPMSTTPEVLIVPGGWQIEGLPATVRRAGPQAAERTVEFFTAQIRNPHTRAAYAAAVTRFFTWCDARGFALAQISPIAVATYIEDMQGRYRAPTIKQYLAAIRRLFDWLVTG